MIPTGERSTIIKTIRGHVPDIANVVTYLVWKQVNSGWSDLRSSEARSSVIKQAVSAHVQARVSRRRVSGRLQACKVCKMGPTPIGASKIRALVV